MRTVTTISVSLERPYLERLDRLARAAGSRSAARRRLLAQDDRRERIEAMEKAYRDYYSEPESLREDLQLTNDMLRISAWPEDPREGGQSHGTPAHKTR